MLTSEQRAVLTEDELAYHHDHHEADKSYLEGDEVIERLALSRLESATLRERLACAVEAAELTVIGAQKIIGCAKDIATMQKPTPGLYEEAEYLLLTADALLAKAKEPA